MWDTIWGGIKSIFIKGVRFVVNAAKAAWEIMKFAIKTAVWVVAGIFTISGHLASYVGKTLSKLFTPEKVVVIPSKKTPALVNFLEQEAERDGIAEDEDVLEISNKLDEAVENNEALTYCIGTDNEGEIAVSDPQFISAEQYDDKIAQADQNDQIYIKKIKIAS